MTKARDLADLGNKTSLDEINDAYNAGALSNRNLIINGAMQVAQRATSVTGQTGSAVLTVDRFQGHGSGATFNMSQQAVTLGGESGLPIQFTKFLRYNATTGANNCGVWQAVEDVTRVQGTHTLSFYAKGTNPAGGAISLDNRQYFGSGGSSQLDDDTRTFSVTSTWQRFTFTITPTVAGKTIGTSSYYRPFFKQPESDNGSAAWTLDITGVQLEVGDTATPFEHRSYGDELAKCQRYYQVFKEEGTATFGVAFAFNATAAYDGSQQIFPVKMRASPSRSTSGTWSTTDGTGATLAITQFHGTTNSWGYQLGFSVASGLSQFRPYGIRALTGSGSQLKFDAEL